MCLEHHGAAMHEILPARQPQSRALLAPGSEPKDPLDAICRGRPDSAGR